MTITPELEKVARYMACVNYGLEFDQAKPHLVQINDVHIALARAALLAIREPTEGMTSAMMGISMARRHECELMFSNAVDHILGETKP